MIGNLLAGKWVYAGLGALVLALVAGLWALNARNEALSAQVGALEQHNGQLTQSLQEQADDLESLSRELNRRDELVRKNQQQRQAAERHARDQIQTLRQALKANQCASSPHPPAVTDSLRAPNHPKAD